MESESPRRARRRAKLQELIDQVGGAAQLARESGTPASHVSAMLAGRRGVGDTLAAKLETLYGKPAGWFDLPGQATKEELALDAGEVAVPVMRRAVSQQAWEYAVRRLRLSRYWVADTIKGISSIDNLKFLHGHKDAMEPTFSDGDVLLIDTGGMDQGKDDGIYVMAAGDRVYVKRLQRKMDGTLTITSDNPAVKTVDVFDDQSLAVLGRVVWVWSGRKV